MQQDPALRNQIQCPACRTTSRAISRAAADPVPTISHCGSVSRFELGDQTAEIRCMHVGMTKPRLAIVVLALSPKGVCDGPQTRTACASHMAAATDAFLLIHSDREED